MDSENKKDVDQLSNLIFGEMSGVNHTFRFSGQRKIRNQSVAEHSYWTAIIAVALARYENKLRKENGRLETPINIGKLYDQCLMHDVDEVVSGDINHLFKHNEDSEQFENELDILLNKKVPDLLFNKILSGEYYKKAWLDSHEDNDYHFLLKMGDWLQLLQYVTEEYQLGNKYFLAIIERVFMLLEQKLLNLKRYSLLYVPILLLNFIKKEREKYVR